MAKYASSPAVMNRPVGEVYAQLSHLSNLQNGLEKLPQEELAKIGEVKFTDDSVVINAPQVGEIRFDVVARREPGYVEFAAANMPVPLKLIVDMQPEGEASTRVVSTIDVDIPAMLRPMVGGKMQEAADRFNQLLEQLGNASL